MFAVPDPLVEPLVRNPVGLLFFPAASNQFRTKFFFFQPLGCLRFEKLGKAVAFGFLLVALVGFGCGAMFGYFTENG